MRKTLIQTLLAAFYAILATAPLEGGGVMLIGMRNAMLLGGWKNPYVTDGLVAMWDGEWNAGPGVHDAAATTWKDLSDHQKDFSWASSTTGLAWADNYLQLTNADKYSIAISHVDGVTGLPQGVARTVEIVMAANWIYFDNPGNVQAPLQLVGSAMPVGRWTGEIVPFIMLPSIYRAFARTGLPFGNWKVVSACIAQQPVSPCSIYANGAKATVPKDYDGNQQATYDRAFLLRSPRADMRLFSTRIYSRALTTEEIAANYAVDKARFNLPDAT